MTTHTKLLDPGFLAAIGEIKQKSSQVNEFGSAILEELPAFKVKNDAIIARKTAVQNQANERSLGYVEKSNKVMQERFAASENPFYDVYAFFTDAPSKTELDTEQNRIASDMNLFAATTNTQIKAMTAEQVALQNDLVLRTNLYKQAQSNIRDTAQSLSAMQLASNQQEGFANKVIGRMDNQLLDDLASGRKKMPGINLTQVAIQRRIRQDSADLKRQGKQAKREDLERNFFEQFNFAQLETFAQDALATGKSIPLGDSGLTMSPATFAAKVKERGDLLQTVQKQRAESAITGSRIIFEQQNISAAVGRFSQGNATPVTNEIFGTNLILQRELGLKQKAIEQAATSGNPIAMRVAMTDAFALQKTITNFNREAMPKLVKMKQDQVENEAAKLAAKEWIETGVFQNDTTAIMYIAESSKIADPASVARLERNYNMQGGINAFLVNLNTELGKAQGDSQLNPQGEIDQNMILAAMYSMSKMRPKIPDIARKAFRDARVLVDGESLKIGDAVAANYSKQFAGIAVNQLMQTHKDEPETFAELGKLLTSEGGFVRADLQDQKGFMSEMYKLTAKLQNSGAIGPQINLATELRRTLTNPETYKANANLLKYSSEYGAIVNRFAFANNMEQEVRERIIRAWSGGLNDGTQVEQEAAVLKVAQTSEALRIEKAGPQTEAGVRKQLANILE